MSQQKKIVINNNSFVGISSRSKTGCTACRKRKKKCDEVHPVCGPCRQKNTKCEWRELDIKKHVYSFDVKPMIESHKMMLLERSGKQQRVAKNTTAKIKGNSSATINSKTKFVKPSMKVAKPTVKEPISSEKRSTKQSELDINGTNGTSIDDLVDSDIVNNTVQGDQGGGSIPLKNIKIAKDVADTFHANDGLNSTVLKEALELTSNHSLEGAMHNNVIFNDTKSMDLNRAVDEIFDNDNMMHNFISNVVDHIRSPSFNPTTNFLDTGINSALKHAHDIISERRLSHQVELLDDAGNTKASLPSSLLSPNFAFSPFDQFLDIKLTPGGNEVENFVFNNENQSQNQDQNMIQNSDLEVGVLQSKSPTCIDRANIQFDSFSADPDNEDIDMDKYLPMDESQLLENAYVSDSDLISIFKSKKLRPYLRPTVHLLLSKNNSLKIINPSSPIMRQLDSTGKLFLENYVTNLAMNQLDIGNNQFFLDYALSQASTDPAILYCLVAWGGMFLVGRDNEEAVMYFNKSFKLIENKRDWIKKSKSGVDNEEHIRLLLFYVLLSCAEISTGDVGRWFQMLLQCKDLLNNYGGLRQFVLKNKNSKVAKWILSNIFYHDVLCTRTLDFGTIISIDEYKDVFKNQNYLQNDDYGLDPFYGLSQNLYLLLGEVANNRKVLKSLKFPLNFVLMDGLEKEINESRYKEIEESWFQIFDSQILSCKPPSDMIELLLKNDPEGKLLEHHLTWYELTQISLRIYIRISFKELEFDDEEIQSLRSRGKILFSILIGTKLQSLLGLSLLMLGVTTITKLERMELQDSYNHFLKNYQILNVQVCWEIIKQVWKQYDEQVTKNEKNYVDWSEVVNSMGWNCCFT